tara:strand:- start:2906 stop:3550 length:645 start_codon:yes stop_codon:yes gene_type:complete
MNYERLNPYAYVFKSKSKIDFETVKPRVLAYLDYANTQHQTSLEKDGGRSSVHLSVTDPPHAWDEFTPFREKMFEVCDEVWKEWKLQPCIKQVKGSWINEHPQGAWTDSHHHHGCHLVVSWYMKQPKNSGRLMIQNPLTPYKMSEPTDVLYDAMGMDWIPIDTEEGDFLVFPGWLKHKTETNNSSEMRYIMSVNISAYRFYGENEMPFQHNRVT